MIGVLEGTVAAARGFSSHASLLESYVDAAAATPAAADRVCLTLAESGSARSKQVVALTGQLVGELRLLQDVSGVVCV